MPASRLGFSFFTSATAQLSLSLQDPAWTLSPSQRSSSILKAEQGALLWALVPSPQPSSLVMAFYAWAEGCVWVGTTSDVMVTPVLSSGPIQEGSIDIH